MLGIMSASNAYAFEKIALTETEGVLVAPDEIIIYQQPEKMILYSRFNESLHVDIAGYIVQHDDRINDMGKNSLLAIMKNGLLKTKQKKDHIVITLTHQGETIRMKVFKGGTCGIEYALSANLKYYHYHRESFPYPQM